LINDFLFVLCVCRGVAGLIVSKLRKYGPWKDALLNAWQKHKSKHKKVGDRVEFFKQVVAEMCATMPKQACPKYWSKHCNRFRGREMGPEVQLKNLGFLRSGRAMGNTNTKVRKFIATWDAIEEAVGSEAPKTVTEWKAKTAAAKNAVKKLPAAPRLKTKYLLSWTIRALLRDRMQQQGIQQLRVNAGTSLNAYIHMCPDMSKALVKARQYLIQVQGKRALKVKDFIQECGGRSPELLSMWMLNCNVITSAVETTQQNQPEKTATALMIRHHVLLFFCSTTKCYANYQHQSNFSAQSSIQIIHVVLFSGFVLQKIAGGRKNTSSSHWRTGRLQGPS
jgi:hypothetical protein